MEWWFSKKNCGIGWSNCVIFEFFTIWDTYIRSPICWYNSFLFGMSRFQILSQYSQRNAGIISQIRIGPLPVIFHSWSSSSTTGRLSPSDLFWSAGWANWSFFLKYVLNNSLAIILIIMSDISSTCLIYPTRELLPYRGQEVCASQRPGKPRKAAA
jgi:hypothetical protein